MLKWHYKVHILWISVSDDQLVDPSRGRIDVQRFIDGELFRFCTGGFAYMQCSVVGSTKGSGDAALIVQSFPQAAPTVVNALLPESAPDELH